MSRKLCDTLKSGRSPVVLLYLRPNLSRALRQLPRARGMVSANSEDAPVEPRQGVVASTLDLHRNGVVGFIAWLDLSTQLPVELSEVTVDKNQSNGEHLDLNILRVSQGRQGRLCVRVDVHVFAKLLNQIRNFGRM